MQVLWRALVQIIQKMDSNTIQQFLEDHPLIKLSGLEELAKIPKGTLRKTKKRKIPEKYIYRLVVVLRHYGLDHRL